MSLEKLVILFSLIISVINIIVPVINNLINVWADNQKTKTEFNRNVKLSALSDFVNSIINFCDNPVETNKDICYSYFSKLHCYYKIDKDFNHTNLFFKDKVNFDELNDFISSLK